MEDTGAIRPACTTAGNEPPEPGRLAMDVGELNQPATKPQVSETPAAPGLPEPSEP